MEITQWISVAQVLATAFVGIVAGFITWKMQSKQIDIAKGVKEIAHAQHETAATKLRLELFERRYEIYDKLLLCVKDFDKDERTSTAEKCNILMEEFKEICKPVKFLFDLSVYQTLTEDVVKCAEDYYRSVRLLLRAEIMSPERDELKKEYEQMNDAFMKISQRIDEMMTPFLKI